MLLLYSSSSLFLKLLSLPGPVPVPIPLFPLSLAASRHLPRHFILSKSLRPSVQVLEECLSSNRSFTELLRTQEAKHFKGSSLSNYLIKPVQRICRYPLFLKDAHKVLVLQDPEAAAACEAALVVVTQIASEINARVKQAEQLAKMVEVHECLNGSFKPGLFSHHRRNRKCIFYTMIEMATPLSRSKGFKSYAMFIFSDFILFARPDHGLFVAKGTVILVIDQGMLDIGVGAGW